VLPSTLHATGDLGVGTITLTWDGSQYWVGSCTANCGDTVQLRFWCGGSDCSGFNLQYVCHDQGGIWPFGAQQLGCTCTPLSVTFGLSLGGPGANCSTNCAGQTLHLTVTL
jgi:hypothetical protein